MESIEPEAGPDQLGGAASPLTNRTPALGALHPSAGDPSISQLGSGEGSPRPSGANVNWGEIGRPERHPGQPPVRRLRSDTSLLRPILRADQALDKTCKVGVDEEALLVTSEANDIRANAAVTSPPSALDKARTPSTRLPGALGRLGVGAGRVDRPKRSLGLPIGSSEANEKIHERLQAEISPNISEAAPTSSIGVPRENFGDALSNNGVAAEAALRGSLATPGIGSLTPRDQLQTSTQLTPPSIIAPPVPQAADPNDLLLDVDDLTLAAHEPDDTVFGPLEPGVLGLLLGAPGISKSTIVLWIAVAVASGVPFAGIKPPRPQRVVIYSPEDAPKIIGRRLIAAIRALGADPKLIKENLRVLTSKNPSQLLEATAEGHGRSAAGDRMLHQILGFKARMVIFDPLVEMHGAEESDNGQMHSVFRVFRSMCQEAKCTLLLTHHIPKEALGKMTFFSGRGAGSMAGAVRCIFTADMVTDNELRDCGHEGIPKKHCVKLELGKHNYDICPDEFRIFRRVKKDFGAFTAPVLEALN